MIRRVSTVSRPDTRRAISTSLCLLLFATSAVPRSPRQSEISLLVPGTIVEREISAGQAHSYHITLSAGQFFAASIRQKGIEVFALLQGSDGRQLDEFSEPVYENIPRKILFIANADGVYQLIIRPRLKDVPPGNYELNVETVRPATEPDRTLVRATQITKEANQILGRATALSAEEAPQVTAKFEEALRLWQSLGETRQIPESFLSLGIVNHRIGEYAKALEFYEKALPLFPPTPEGMSSKATTLNNMADIALRSGETRTALESYLKSLALKKEGSRSWAITLDNVGAVYNRLGEHQLALDHHLRALASFRALGRHRDEAVALNNLAWLWESIGDPQRSIEFMLQALPLVKEAGAKDSEALYLSNAGYFHFLLGEHQQALAYANQSLTLSRAINNRRTEAGSLTLLCKIYPALGEFEKATEACHRVLPVHQDRGDRINSAVALTALARIFERTGETRKAIEAREAALAIYRAISDPTGEMITLHALGQIALDGGELIAAREPLERAVDMAESRRVKAGGHQLRSAYMASRQQVYESYIDLLMLMHRQEPDKGHEQTALQISERARARGLLDLLGEAHAEIRQGADAALLEKERTLLERLSAKDAAWKQLQNNKQPTKQAASLAHEVNELTTQLQLVEAQIRSSNSRYAALTQPQPLTHAEIQRQLLDENTVLLEFALGDKRSYLWAVTPTSSSTFWLPPRREIETTARKVYALLVARQPKKSEEEAAYQTRVAQADAELHGEAARLGEMLLGPLAAKLRGEWKGKRLLIVAPGALEYLPFAALPLAADEGLRPLIVNHEIVNLPSASVLALIRREDANRPAASGTLAIVADPVFEATDPRLATVARRSAPADALIARVRSSNESQPYASLPASDSTRAVRSLTRESFPRLPFSREEAEAIAALIPKASLFKATDFQANRAIALSGALSRYRIVHFATHGLLNSEHPELSGLVLSLVDENGRAQDGFLRLHEVYNLRLPAEVVVLSACQTALGKEIRGEGLVGFTRGFMYAGARRVVASLWQVDDLATAELMKRFYGGMLKDRMRPAAALRAAQLELMRQKRWRSPYYWAAFVLQGEYR